MICSRRFYLFSKNVKPLFPFLFIFILTFIAIQNEKVFRKFNHNNQRIFCIILTMPQNLNNKTKLVFDLWVNKCDGHIFLSTIPDELLNDNQKKSDKIINGLEIDIGFKVFQPPNYTKEKYGKLTDKTLSAFKYVYQYNSDFDFYLKADDDTYIFMDNLRLFLSSKNRTNPFAYGYKYQAVNGYLSGGAGYLLTNEAITRLINGINGNKINYLLSQIEDIDISKMLKKVDVNLKVSVDEKGRDLFHPFSIKHHYEGYFPKWMQHYPENPVKKVLFL